MIVTRGEQHNVKYDSGIVVSASNSHSKPTGHRHCSIMLMTKMFNLNQLALLLSDCGLLIYEVVHCTTKPHPFGTGILPFLVCSITPMILTSFSVRHKKLLEELIIWYIINWQGGLLADVTSTLGTDQLVAQNLVQVRAMMQQLYDHRLQLWIFSVPLVDWTRKRR